MAKKVATGVVTFGALLRQLRRRAGLTQGELAVLVGFSVAQISRLEKDERLPDPQMVMAQFLPALMLDDEPRLAQQLVALAAGARGERPPTMLVTERQVHTSIHEEILQSAEIGGYLPGLPLPLVGRERDIDTICKRLMAAPGRLLTLLGPPGVGKTQLALACAAQVGPLFADGVYFIALAAVTDAAYVPSAIAAGMNLVEREHRDPRLRLLETLRRKTTLLVLDNFEQVSAAAPLVAELLSGCAGLRVLVTSQEPLRLRAEQRQQVQPLAPAAAVELFLQRAQAINPDFTADEQAVAAITAIVLRLDCLPLAIELVAAQLELFSPQQLLARLADQALDLLATGPRDLPPHQQTLRNALRRSYTLLSDTEQRLLRLLSVFAGGCTTGALTVVASAAGLSAAESLLIDLRTLLRKSLVQQQQHDGGERLRMLTTIRDFALEQLAVIGEQLALHRAHASYFLALARSSGNASAGGSAVATTQMEQLEQEHDNLRAALRWSLAAEPTLALDLAVALSPFWETRGHDYEARQWLTQALQANPQPTAARAAALVTAADFARRQADYAVAQTLITEAQQLYTAQQHDAGLAYALRQAGWLAYDRHDKAATLAAFQQSLALYRTLADPAGVADLLVCLVHFLGGVPEHRQDVQAYLAESLAIYQTLDHVEGIVHVLQQQGELEMAAGNYAVAQQHFADALQRWRALGVKWQIGWALALMGEAAWLQQDLATADRCYQEAYTIFVTLGNQDGIMILHHHLAQVARRRGEMTKAQAGYLESLSLSRILDNQHMVARALIGLGGVALHAGSTHLAVRLFGAAQAILDQLPPFLSPVDAAELTGMINAACTALGKVQFQEQWQAAQAMTLEEVLIHESIDAR